VIGLRRKRKVPADVRAKLDRDERVIASAPTVSASSASASTALASTVDRDSAVVVTNRGLWLPGRDRLGWHEIHKATWSGPRLTVVPAVAVSEADRYTVMADDVAVVVALTGPGDVPAEVRDRVTRSVAYTAHHPLPGGGVRVVGRRVPGVNGVVWHVRYDEGTDAGDPDIVARTDDLVAQAARPKPE
jgi:hypothetical protein